MTQELIFHIGLNQIKGVGPVNTKKIVAYCGGLEAVFKEKQSNLEKIPNVGPVLASQIKNSSVLSRAEEELVFIRKNNIKCLSYWGDNYPQKLKHCKDAPTLLFSKGNVNFENPKIISVVGTRNASSYGSSFCKEFIQELAPYSPLIVSGVAYGIDKFAHKESLKNNLQTLGILAHGLDRIYPHKNKKLADLIKKQKPLRKPIIAMFYTRCCSAFFFQSFNFKFNLSAPSITPEKTKSIVSL